MKRSFKSAREGYEKTMKSYQTQKKMEIDEQIGLQVDIKFKDLMPYFDDDVKRGVLFIP